MKSSKKSANPWFSLTPYSRASSSGTIAHSSSHNSLSSATILQGEEVHSSVSSKAGPAGYRPGSADWGRDGFKFSKRASPPGPARTRSCNVAALGCLGGGLPNTQTKAIMEKHHARRNSADSSEVWRKQSNISSLQHQDSQKRKWKSPKKENIDKFETLLESGEHILDELCDEHCEKNLAKRTASDRLDLKVETEEFELGPVGHGLQRSQSMRHPAGRRGGVARNRTSKYVGVGSSNRKNQWQARILVHGKVTHLGYYQSEEEAAMVYDRVAVSLHGPNATTNFPASRHTGSGELFGLGREDLQRALGVKPMDKSSRFRGVSRKKGKWEAKVMVNRKWAYRALFDSEDDAAHAYDAAVRRLKPREASSFVNFGPEEAAKRRSTHVVLPATRSKSQRLSLPKGEARLKRNMHSFPDVLTLDEEHIPSQVVDLDAPSTPTRPPSALPTPVSPLSGKTRISNIMPPSAFGDLSSTDSFTTEQLPVTMQGSASPVAKSCNSLAQMPLGIGPTALNLPDPNSIGVPPPDNLPYPELVSTPFSASAAANSESVVVSHTSGGLPPRRSTDSGARRSLSRASSRRSSFTLPEIPRPILEPSSIMSSHEKVGLGMENYFSSTPLSQELGQGLDHLQTSQRQEMPQSQFASQSGWNPFQEAKVPTPSTPPSPLAHAGSGVFSLPPHPSVGLAKLRSMPESELSSLTQQVMPVTVHRSPTLQSTLARAASTTLPRSQMSAMDSLSGFQGSGLTEIPMDLLGLAAAPVYLQQQQASASGRTLEMSSSGLVRHSGGSHRAALPFKIGNQIITDQALGMGDIPGISTNGTSYLHAMDSMDTGMSRGQQPCLMTYASLPAQLEGPGPTQLLTSRNQGCSDNSVAQMCHYNAIENEVIGDNATDLLNGLLSENVDPTNHQCVQIGGEFLHAYDSANLASNPDILGRTPI